MAKKTLIEKMGIKFTDENMKVEDIPDLSCTFTGTPRKENGDDMDWGHIVFGLSSKESNRMIMLEGTKEDLKKRFESLIYQLVPSWVHEVEGLVDDEAEELALEMKEAVKEAKIDAKEEGKTFDEDSKDNIYEEVQRNHNWSELAEASEDIGSEIYQRAIELANDPKFGDDEEDEEE